MLLEQDPEFRPITITLETQDEAEALWAAVTFGVPVVDPCHHKILTMISDWFSSKAKI